MLLRLSTVNWCAGRWLTTFSWTDEVLNMPVVAVALSDHAAIVPTAPRPRTMPSESTARVRIQPVSPRRLRIRAPRRASPPDFCSVDILLSYFDSEVGADGSAGNTGAPSSG